MRYLIGDLQSSSCLDLINRWQTTVLQRLILVFASLQVLQTSDRWRWTHVSILFNYQFRIMEFGSFGSGTVRHQHSLRWSISIISKTEMIFVLTTYQMNDICMDWERPLWHLVYFSRVRNNEEKITLTEKYLSMIQALKPEFMLTYISDTVMFLHYFEPVFTNENVKVRHYA